MTHTPSTDDDLVGIHDEGSVRTITIRRPDVRNAVDRATAQRLFDAFVDFDNDPALSVAVLTGSNGNFCAGADLKAVSTGRGNRIGDEAPDAVIGSIGPMGPTRLQLTKPVIAAVEGYAVAGGLELACWADLRVASHTARFGVFCRRWGVPLVDGGTIRLPQLIGRSHATDLILTGREVDALEAHAMGLANRVVEAGHALDAAVALANDLAALPQNCLRSDRRAMLDGADMSLAAALHHESAIGRQTVASGETVLGATRFREGAGRHGRPATT